MSHLVLKPVVLRKATPARRTARLARLAVPVMGLAMIAAALFVAPSPVAARVAAAEATEAPARPAAQVKVTEAAEELLRPAPKAKTVRMLVTAYCPCKKCCGSNAKGITASGKPVSHNGGRFVAADPRVLPLGSKIMIPGYDAAAVPVIDTGSAIKGKRIDVYFPSHRAALEWGKQWVDVTVMD